MYTKPDDFILSDDMTSSDESFSVFFRDAILQFGIGFCFLVIIVQSVCFKDKGNYHQNQSSKVPLENDHSKMTGHSKLPALNGQ